MLHDFIARHRDQIIARTRKTVAARLAPVPTTEEMVYGVPLFLDQLASRVCTIDQQAIGASASLHGLELLKTGFTVGQVVHDYGNICQVITELAEELGAQIPNDDFRTLNLCLDVAIAEAVTEYSRQREYAIEGRGLEQLGFLAHELRNLLNTATLAFEAVRSGSVGIAGSTGSILGKSLLGMRDLVSRSLAEVRLEAGPPHHDRVHVASLLEEVEIAAALHARTREIRLSIETPDVGVIVDGDSQILASIVTNLVQNACKFTTPHGQVTVKTRTLADRVLIDVADQCGGLATAPEDLFRPYTRNNADRSGLGLGLAISLKGARALGGEIHVRNVPGTGCVFTLDLKRAAVQPARA